MHGSRYDAVLDYIRRHERTLASVSFLGGLVNDLLTFTLLPLRYVVILFGLYVLIAAGATLAAHAAVGKEGRIAGTVTAFAPLVAHFVLGSVLCGFLILLTQSGAFLISWPFLLLIGGVFVGNELFQTYRRHFIFQTLLLYLALFAFFTIAVPLFLGRMSSWTFLLSSSLSLVFFIAYLWLVGTVRWERLRPTIVPTITATLVITLLIIGAYWLRLIPPIPLALRDGGIYERVERVGDEYVRSGGSERPWWDLRAPVIQIVSGSPLYAYSAVFAPGDFTTTVVHVWQRQDEATGAWNTRSTVAFTLSGGREEGYRGYSIKSAPEPGEWRVLVQTYEGQTIGDLRFSVRHE